ncbi:hypothetical protein AruPA_19235 [Acidiphilium sp. PA]|uniref:hypothetical protein n=1 Tax=Acidiphilium sp. PA TaxID=2871705 RepID=UPI002243F61D|nr:hypothetical protein [Acidiphilium sp. PA]MCW8309171.1 hypothetical protein [Acidiphilium sp. PA]
MRIPSIKTATKYFEVLAALEKQYGTIDDAITSLGETAGPKYRPGYIMIIKAAIKFRAAQSDDKVLLKKINGLVIPESRIKDKLESSFRRIEHNNKDVMLAIIKHLDTARDRLRNNNADLGYIWSQRASWFLQATLCTGIKPIEWINAFLLDDKDFEKHDSILFIKVSDKTEDDTAGEERVICVCGEKDVDIINKHLQSVSDILESGISYKTYVTRTQKCINKAFNHCFPNSNERFTLISARNMFYSRMIEAGFSNKRVCYLMGIKRDRNKIDRSSLPG